jgi:hypothetical protein
MDQIIEVVGNNSEDFTRRAFLDLNRKLRREFLDIAMQKYNPQLCRSIADVR